MSSVIEASHVVDGYRLHRSGGITYLEVTFSHALNVVSGSQVKVFMFLCCSHWQDDGPARTIGLSEIEHGREATDDGEIGCVGVGLESDEIHVALAGLLAHALIEEDEPGRYWIGDLFERVVEP